jgi:hypothetical protein
MNHIQIARGPALNAAANDWSPKPDVYRTEIRIDYPIIDGMREGRTRR